MERRRIFRDDADRINFINRLGQVIKDTQTACFAWALIPNHAHFLLRTGQAPIATVMSRILTGYAVSFNRRYHRHGKVFQNRYKSILCQEDVYLKELVRYIHLNPLRAKLVLNLAELERFPWSGHGVLTGRLKQDWQDSEYVLSLFGHKVGEARRRYRAYIEKGVGMGRRPEFTGGGMIRSVGGWDAVKAMRRGQLRLKGDERILGDSDFVENVLKYADEQLARP